MQLPEGMTLQGLAQLGNLTAAGEEGGVLTARMFDTDGDGRQDLFLLDLDNDGTVDGVVRGFDTDGDGVGDTFIRYDEDGSIVAVGRLDPETGELDVTSEGLDDVGEMLSALGLSDRPGPDNDLFTSFDDPYFIDTFGSAGEDVPEALGDADTVDVLEVREVDAADLDDADNAEAAVEPEAEASAEVTADGTDEDLPEATPRVVEIEDRSGAEDGSDLYAKIDTDGDQLADSEERLSMTSDGTWHGDIDKDGYSEDVAFDRDLDGRIESVDTTGQGSTTDTVDAESVADPESPQIVDQHPGEDDDDVRVEEAQAADWAGGEAGDDADDVAVVDEGGDAAGAAEDFGSSDYESGGGLDSDAGSGESYDAGTSFDSGSTDSGSSSSDGDAGGSTIDTDSGTGSGDTD
jgi:hypothetical protein